MELIGKMPLEDTSSVCLGSGRFLRAVLVPALELAGLKTIVFQTRGDSFPRMMAGPRKASGSFEVDTVEFDGRVVTTEHSIVGAGTLGTPEGRAAWLSLPSRLPRLRVIGVGVTEAGIAPKSQAMKDLAEFLLSCYKSGVAGPLSIINTDNVPGNGPKIHAFVAQGLEELLSDPSEREGFLSYLSERVVFHSTMVDRITSQRAGDADVPRAEPLPKKALVIEDLRGVLPAGLSNSPGVVVRGSAGQIEVDHQLKLRIANAIHTAMVYLMVLSRLADTSLCIGHPYILPYIRVLYEQDIARINIDRSEVDLVYEDWVRRLQHPQFGLSCLFVCQNASQKLGIRLAPTIACCIKACGLPSPALALAVAALLRFLTPLGPQPRMQQGVFSGRMDAVAPGRGCPEGPLVYASDMKADYTAGTYEFKDTDGAIPRLLMAVCRAKEAAGIAEAHPPGAFSALQQAVGQVLLQQPGAEASSWGPFVSLVASYYNRLLEGTPVMRLLKSVMEQQGGKGGEDERPLTAGDIGRVVAEEVDKVEVVDLHTHLFPPSHEALMLWGIDELLTYHYLIAEFFQTAPRSITPEHYFSLSKAQQADLVWDALFIKTSPLSEACKGVLTTLEQLGLREELRARDLPAIRQWFAAQDPEEYCERVFQLSRVRYCVMTNIPFEPEEARHWRPVKKPYSKRFRSALRVDPLLKGDWEAVAVALKAAGYPETFEGAKQYLRDWASTMQPEYLMASTPHDFSYHPHEGGSCGATHIDNSPKGAELLDRVLMPIAEELRLPIAMKLGAHRGVNPSLRTGGDGVVAADVGYLRRLCSKYPNVKFLATFLARVSQHEAAVLANKFPNLHLYGCWWYCNNPSIIREITAMRVEILGTGFTAQHSDARVLDQLIYKWQHSRGAIAEVLTGEYAKVQATGWRVSRADVRRDVARLLGGAYEEFMAK